MDGRKEQRRRGKTEEAEELEREHVFLNFILVKERPKDDKDRNRKGKMREMRRMLEAEMEC